MFTFKTHTESEVVGPIEDGRVKNGVDLSWLLQFWTSEAKNEKSIGRKEPFANDRYPKFIH